MKMRQDEEGALWCTSLVERITKLHKAGRLPPDLRLVLFNE
jgi:hypothetical protein